MTNNGQTPGGNTTTAGAVEQVPVSVDFSETVGRLASGAVLRYTRDDGLELVIPVKQPNGVTITRLIHHGWLVSTTGCGGYQLSDAGLQAYLRSTDELGDGALVDPHGYRP